jgi:competence protein ComEA
VKTCLRSSIILSILIYLFLSFPACDSGPTAEIKFTTVTPQYTGQIYISGAVNNPGYYPLKAEDTLAILIQAAGGLKPGADSTQVKLTLSGNIQDGQPQKVDINRAEAWLLQAIPGIGATLAQNIISYRQQSGLFRSTGDLLKVRGIGQSTLDKMLDYISVSDTE